jgi:hypothetical protein
MGGCTQANYIVTTAERLPVNKTVEACVHRIHTKMNTTIWHAKKKKKSRARQIALPDARGDQFDWSDKQSDR